MVNLLLGTNTLNFIFFHMSRMSLYQLRWHGPHAQAFKKKIKILSLTDSLITTSINGYIFSPLPALSSS